MACKGGWNYHAFPLGSSICSVCGYDKNTEEVKVSVATNILNAFDHEEKSGAGFTIKEMMEATGYSYTMVRITLNQWWKEGKLSRTKMRRNFGGYRCYVYSRTGTN